VWQIGAFLTVTADGTYHRRPPFTSKGHSSSHGLVPVS